VGVLLPCTIVAREVGGNTVIDFMDPVTVLGIANNETVNKFAQDAEERLKAAIADIEHR
jgi:3-keto-L-gulonate-6-phosphate decarboxylase